MTIRESVPPTTVEVTVVLGPAARDRRDDLAAGLDDLSVLSVSAVRPLSALDRSGLDRPALVVSDTRPPADVPDGDVVWATTEPEVAAAVGGDAAVVNWGPDDDWAMLEARLGAEFDGPTADPRRRQATRTLERFEDAIVALDTDHRVTYLNDAATELLDLTRDQLEGQPVWEYTPPGVEADLRPAIDEALEGGDAVTTTVELDAGVTLFEAAVYPGPAGVTVQTSGPDSGSDPSLYEYLVETVGDAVYILDDDGRFVFVNDALCEMTGYEREELLGSSVHIIKDDETVERAEDALRELLKSRAGQPDSDGINIAKLDIDLVRKDGERVPSTDRMTLRPLEDGEFTGTVGTLRDISRQHRRQELLNGLIERSREMMTATDTGAVTELVVSTAVDVFGLDLAALREYDPEADALVPVVTSAAAEDLLGDRPLYGPQEGLVGEAFTEGELVVAEDLPANSRTDVTAIESGAYLPIGDTYVLSLGQSTDEDLDEVTLGLLEVLGETAAAALDRVRREEHLRQYEAVVEAAEELLFTVDDDRRFTLVTRPFARLLGYEREELVGRRLVEFLPEGALDDEPTTDGPAVLETTLTGKGDDVPARVTLSPFADGVVGTVRDISQLQSARQEASRQRRRFVELFETLSDPVADVRYEDGVAILESINPAFAELCDRSTETLQQRTLDAAQDAMPSGLAAALDPVGTSEPSVETTTTVQTPSGERHYLLRTAPYESNGTDRAFVLLTDVTEVRRRGTHLKVLHRLLRHNLRNRTALIRGHAEQLARLDLPETADDHIDSILAASDDLVDASETSQTVQRVLGFDADEVETAPADEALARLRTDVDTSVPHPETSVTVTADTDEAVPFSKYLLVAVRELVENAVEHEPASSVEVTATSTEAGVELSVADDGTGIPEQQWDLLTGEQEITQLQHGDGLGLWLVKWVTDRHGGRLRLDQADEGGTTVTLVFPTADAS